MSRRTRTIRYGASIVLVLVGAVCGATISGSAGGTLATVFVGIGLVGVVSLIFYEVGLTEDRERDPDREQGTPPVPPPPGPSASAKPHDEPRRSLPDRMRGQHRRLR